jgi:hypothetical protein
MDPVPGRAPGSPSHLTFIFLRMFNIDGKTRRWMRYTVGRLRNLLHAVETLYLFVRALHPRNLIIFQIVLGRG